MYGVVCSDVSCARGSDMSVGAADSQDGLSQVSHNYETKYRFISTNISMV